MPVEPSVDGTGGSAAGHGWGNSEGEQDSSGDDSRGTRGAAGSEDGRATGCSTGSSALAGRPHARRQIVSHASVRWRTSAPGARGTEGKNGSVAVPAT